MERFQFNNLPSGCDELIDAFAENYWEHCKDEKTTENLVKAYKMIIINIIRYKNSDVSSILINRGINDPMTQQKINQHFIEHINSHIESIINPLLSKIGVFTLENDKIVVDFMTDFNIADNYLAEVHASALEATICELGTMMEKQILLDCEHLENIYKLVKQEDREKTVSDYCEKNDKTLFDKYGPIILMMPEFGFKSSKFKSTMQYFASNLSIPYTDIIRKYYTMSFKKDKEYKRNMVTVEKFIEVYEKELLAIRNKEEFVRDVSANAQKEKYKSWIN